MTKRPTRLAQLLHNSCRLFGIMIDMMQHYANDAARVAQVLCKTYASLLGFLILYYKTYFILL